MRWPRALLFVSVAFAQSASVAVPEALVYDRAGGDANLRGKLSQGQAVVVDLRVTAAGTPWCSIVRAEPRLSGYVDCSQLAVSGPSPEQARAAFYFPPNDKLNELIQATGIERSIRQALHPSQFTRVLDQKRLDPATAQDLIGIFTRTGRPELFLQPIRSALRENYTDRMADAFLDWARSPLGRRLTSLEAAAEERLASNADDLARFLQQANAVSPSRVGVIERMWRSADFSDIQIETAISIVRALAQGLNPNLPQNQRLSEQGFREIAAGLQGMKPAVVAAGKARLAYVYRDASDAELLQYIQVLESPAGRWLMNGTGRGSLQGGRAFASQLGTALAEYFDQRRGRRPVAQ